ncbi:glycosyltransferase family 2 protein [Lacicoccus alkaliphilus]|uniref:Glycosyl transferase family 2 n=1 Tax=Lacicoccus alkaliphilus DSM 16010 TaxID=1123231 RepID=A0A1M7H5V2_9BACL|nr:glycosyltransferase family 2 protein [Salinicoccus alkaliphilus]SHM23964.1 Glycosyl transferase family 2 [Salinicoccus alkaliphilus DSM 16010]
MIENEQLAAKLQALRAELARSEAGRAESFSRLAAAQAEFDNAEKFINYAKRLPQKLKGHARAAGAYALGRRNRRQLYSPAYRHKDAQNKLKPYTYHLYDLGFTDRALKDLEALYSSTRKGNLKKAAAWELALWHANTYTVDGARQAFAYLASAVEGVKDADFLRRAAIIAAECADRAGCRTSAVKVLDTVMAHEHPDVHLAMANLEDDLDKRAEWINRAMAVYGITPIQFDGSTYEDLTAVAPHQTEGPKVTVIMPAYNAAEGIATGIESILNQTWQNIEVIVVDDCSPDDTVEVVKKYAAADSRIRLLSTPENSGPYVARNIALKEATGEFVTINDADDWSHPEKIEKQAEHLIDDPHVMANTSAHARLTEELKLHRRGTPGTYIFSNMSSLMFRRAQVLEKIGYWDTVRFAADSEYKKRITAVFGKDAVVDLDSGPLSFPRQSSGSLTGSSAFGYKGFLAGVRKEYAEVHNRFHRQADELELHYPYNQTVRKYPVPEPMWSKRERQPGGYRNFDVVIIADFRMGPQHHQDTLKEVRLNKERGLRTGLLQMAHYDFNMPKKIDESIRHIIDGDQVQMLVYGEYINAEIMLIKHSGVFLEHQAYVPGVKARVVRGIVAENSNKLRQCSRNASEYAGKEVKWHPVDDTVRKSINAGHIRLSAENWTDYASRLDDWIY